MRKTKLERIMEDKDFPVVETVVALLRSRAPQLVPTNEIAYITRRGNVYGLIKKGRTFLAETTGEFIPNRAKRIGRSLHGYTVTKDDRAAMFEETKSIERARGHLATATNYHRRIQFSELSSNDDIKMYLALQHKVRAAEFFLTSCADAEPIATSTPENKRLTEGAREDSKTPWETLGLSDPTKSTDEND